MKTSVKVVLSDSDKKVVDAFYRFFNDKAGSDRFAEAACLEMRDSLNNWLMRYAVDENGLPYAYCG